MTAPLCFVDTETTSLRRPWMPAGRQVWDVAIIRREPDGPAVEWQAFVECNEADADPFSLQIGGYRGRYSWPWAVEAAARTIQELTVDAHLVGAVPSFDEESLVHLLYQHGLLPRWHYHLVDVEALVAGKFGLAPPWDSHALTEAAGVEYPSEEERHTALGDARWAMRLYDAVIS